MPGAPCDHGQQAPALERAVGAALAPEAEDVGDRGRHVEQVHQGRDPPRPLGPFPAGKRTTSGTWMLSS